jgi:hypothetical protein
LLTKRKPKCKNKKVFDWSDERIASRNNEGNLRKNEQKMRWRAAEKLE